MSSKTKKDDFQGIRSIINSNNEFKKIKNIKFKQNKI